MTQTLRSTSLVANNLPVPSPLGSLEAYIGAVHRIPVLSVEEEQGLARRFGSLVGLFAPRQGRVQFVARGLHRLLRSG